ncbi:hypothetical protein MRX96_009598 [Rhipicephalus microplus]
MEEIKERSSSRSKHRRGSRGRTASFPRLPERQEGELPPMTGPVNEERGDFRLCCPQQWEIHVAKPQESTALKLVRLQKVEGCLRQFEAE